MRGFMRCHLTDWVREMAEEIWSGVFNPDDIVAIIEKHCPFKRDTAYQEVASNAPADRALELLHRLVLHCSWFLSAIEIDRYATDCDMNGEDLYVEAERIIKDAGLEMNK